MKRIGTLEIDPKAKTWLNWASSYIGGSLMNHFKDPSSGFCVGPLGSDYHWQFATYTMWMAQITGRET